MAKDNLVPIKVKIRYGKHPKTGKLQHIYPDFNSLPGSVRANMDWSEFFDLHGIGWHYDKLSGIGEVDAGNPDSDIWWGCTCIPKDFADAAVATFPNDVEALSKTSFEDFYNNRAHVRDPEIIDDAEALQNLKVRVDLGDIQKTDKEYADALDPDNPTPGRQRNPRKTWVLCKAKIGVDFDASVED